MPYGGIESGSVVDISKGISDQSPLYFMKTPEGAAFSVSAHELAQRTNGKLDRLTIASILCEIPLREGYSLYEGVEKIVAGEKVSISPTHVKREVVRIPQDPNATLYDAAELSRKAIISAVRTRIARAKEQGGSVSSDFSGGLDSTSLAFVAAGQLNTLPCYMQYQPDYPAGDLGYARHYAALEPKVHLHEMVGTLSELPFLDRNAPPFSLDEPYRGMAILGRERQRICRIQNDGHSVHLTGNGGDALYDPYPIYRIAELIRSGHLGAAEKDATTFARLYCQAPERVFLKAYRLSETTLSDAYVALAEFLTRAPSQGKIADNGWLTMPQETAHWLNPSIRQALAEQSQAVAKDVSSYDGNIADFVVLEGLRDSHDAQRHLGRLASGAFSLEAPYLDEEVINAALIVPASERTRIGDFKPMLRMALADHSVPRQVFERRGKGAYSTEMLAGLRRAIPAILELLKDSRLGALEIIQPNAVRQTIEEIDLMRDPPWSALAQFVSLEIWLRQLEQMKGIAPPILFREQSNERESSVINNEVLSKTYVLSHDAVFAEGTDGQIVALRLENDAPYAMNAAASMQFKVLIETGSPTAVMAVIKAEHPGVNDIDITQSVTQTIIALTEAGLIEVGTSSPRLNPRETVMSVDPLSKSNEQIRSHPVSLEGISVVETQNAQRSLSQALLLKTKGINAMCSYFKALHKECADNAEVTEVQRYLAILREVSKDNRYQNEKVACAERSIAAVLMGATYGHRIGLTLGVAFDPLVFHAWPELDNTPIISPADEPVDGRYKVLFRYTYE